MIDDIRRFGPILGAVTEIFECYNGVFRQCSIYSNRLAPSRDIALELAQQESFKHRLLGGFWHSRGDRDEWVSSGPMVLDFMRNHPMIQRHIGWTEQKTLGSIKLTPYKKGTREHMLISWKDSIASRAVNSGNFNARDKRWIGCLHAVSQSGEACPAGSWVFGTFFSASIP